MNTQRPNRTLGLVTVMIMASIAAACQPSDAQPSQHRPPTASDAKNATRLLKAADPKVCTSPAVTATVISIVQSAWSPPRWTQGERTAFLNAARLVLHDQTATSVDASLPVVACEGTFTASEGSQVWENRVAYRLTLLLDTEEVRVEVDDVRVGAQVIAYAASEFGQSVVDARYRNERDRQVGEVCDEFRRGEGRWSPDEIYSFVSRIGDISDASGLRLDGEAQACDRQIRAAHSDALNAHRAAFNAQQATAVQAEKDEEARREREAQENRVEYSGPPPILAPRPREETGALPRPTGDR